MSEWQPIETAPYDENVLLWMDGGSTIGIKLRRKGWALIGYFGWDKPTLWHPLPDSPVIHPSEPQKDDSK